MKYYNATIQKHIAANKESGVIIYFSFLLLEIKFITVFKERYTAITIPIILVVPGENHNDTKPPNWSITTTKRICRINCVAKAILNFLGKTLYFPPIVNSPNGSPHNIKKDNPQCGFMITECRL